MEKDVSSHAQSNRTALGNSEMIKESEGVQRTLPMCNRGLRIVRSAVATCIGLDERVFMQEGLPASVNPIFVTSGAAV
jgi:hypothetical protein